MAQPIVLVVHGDARALGALRRDLARRYRADYRVVAEREPVAALGRLEWLGRRGEPVALVVAAQGTPGMTGLELLERARDAHPGAKLALLVRYGDPSADGEIARAATLGRLDRVLTEPWYPLEECLYRPIGELLADREGEAGVPGPRFEAVRVVGRRWSRPSHVLRDLLERNGVPSGFYSDDSEEGRGLLREAGQDGSRLPVVITHDGRVLADPVRTEVAAALGVDIKPEPGVYDVTVIGAGPAGLSAAVYAASEGLRTLVVEPQAIGGQAGTSSLIRNYLGFPHGISGGRLARLAYQQAKLFGAGFVYNAVTGLEARGPYRTVRLAHGGEALSRAVVVATGVEYRRLGAPGVERLLGAGVFYGAAMSEAPAVRGQQVYLVGAGNSAGQAAVYLARYAERVTVLARGGSLGASMSDYLVREVEATPNIEVRLGATVAEAHGAGRLERLTIEDATTGRTETVPAAALFVMIGAEPRTGWLDGAVERDERGYVLTGADLAAGGPPGASLFDRQPYMLEASMPGVFAVGDVRLGSVKRVASAVGEGSIAIRSVHEYLRARAAGEKPTAPTGAMEIRVDERLEAALR